MGSVKERLVEFYNTLGISKREFERTIGAANGYIDKLKHAPTNEKMESILLHYPQLNKIWLLTGEGQMLNYQDDDRPRTAERGSPCFDLATIQGGSAQGTGMEQLMAKDAIGMMSVPGMPVGEGIPYIKVRGSSMVNRRDPAHSIPEGAWIGIRPSQSSAIRWGEVYAIMTTDGPVVKKVMPSEHEGYITCVSFNEEDGYLPYELPTAEIIPPLYHVVAVITAKAW